MDNSDESCEFFFCEYIPYPGWSHNMAQNYTCNNFSHKRIEYEGCCCSYQSKTIPAENILGEMGDFKIEQYICCYYLLGEYAMTKG